MIAFLRGKVVDTTDDAIVLEVNGIGFQILMPLSNLDQIGLETDLLIYTHLSHREDAMLLYGFLSREEKSLFKKLINVSGIGPKTALSVLSVLTTEQFCQAIIEEDTKTISTVPGIGLKTAQRLILELKSKIKKEVQEDSFKQRIAARTSNRLIEDDAIDALIALGYQQNEAVQAVNKVASAKPELDLQELIREALKLLMR